MMSTINRYFIILKVRSEIWQGTVRAAISLVKIHKVVCCIVMSLLQHPLQLRFNQSHQILILPHLVNGVWLCWSGRPVGQRQRRTNWPSSINLVEFGQIIVVFVERPPKAIIAKGGRPFHSRHIMFVPSPFGQSSGGLTGAMVQR